MLSIIDYLLPPLAYCFGSVSSAIVVCRVMGLTDPRSAGSHNPGATNVLRIGGWPAAAITLIGDVLKGLIPILAARGLTDNTLILSLVGAAAFLGHLYPVFFGFKGGKGVATACGVFLGISGVLTLILMAVWLTMAVLFRYSSLAALTTATLAPLLVLWLLPDPWLLTMSLLIMALLFWRHRGNITRLLTGTESKIKLKSS